MLSAGNMEVRQGEEEEMMKSLNGSKNSNDYTSTDLSFYSIKDEVLKQKNKSLSENSSERVYIQ
ncbi:hypothetical protein Taro_021287, partial [Colocasia esculenta]|nr:hypothetical protein [Colocasia esculenta]